MPSHPRYAEDVELDEANEAEMARHGVAGWESAEVFWNGPIWAGNKQARTGEWLMLGRTEAGRALTVPVAYDPARSLVRPITAWDSSAAELVRFKH
jgi:uncharacterized DUF497 family protein